MVELAFWFSLVALGYAYAGFPLLVIGVGAARGRAVRAAPITPSVSLIIAAYNEEEHIGRRLDNALADDYPPERLEILVASDGSSDRTESIAESYGARGVRVLRLPRRGKIPALDAAVREARGEILVFSDANVLVGRGALRALVRSFADPEVGGVAGHTGYRLEPGSESSSRGEGLYWRYDTWLKRMESRTGSVVSAHGGLHALRRELYDPPPDTAVTDDFIISTAAVAAGRRLVFEPEARAWETAAPKAEREFRRRVRLTTRGLRGVMGRRALLNPFRHGFYSAVLFSHKVLRRLVVLLLPVLFATSLVLAPTGRVPALAAAGQLLVYGLATGGALARGHRLGRAKLLFVPFYYCMANAAALVALVGFVRGHRIRLWQPQRHSTGV